MSNLRAGVPYHIQNVDSGRFLELQDRVSEAEVKMRPAKRSEKQLWTAFPDRQDPDIFLFENVANKSWLGTITDGKQFSQLVGQSRALAGRWWITGNNEDGFRIGVAAFTKTTAFCLELGEFGAILVQKKKQNDAQKWRFLAHNEIFQPEKPRCTDVLTTGLYRIRTIDGSAVLGLSEGSVDIDPRVKHTGAMAHAAPFENPQTSYKWAVILEDDGRYTIQDAEQQLYLGSPAYDCYQHGAVHGMKESFGWEITSIGGMAYTITTRSPSGPLAIGFRDYQVEAEKQLALMPASRAHSQVWFFETWEEYDIPAESRARGASTSSSSTPRGSSTRGPNDFHGPADSELYPTGEDGFTQGRPSSRRKESNGGDDGKRLPEGHYFIRNVGAEKYLNLATSAFLKSEPTHAPSRFLVRARESNAGTTYQIIPHSYAGQQSLVWDSDEEKLVVQDATSFVWQLVHIGESAGYHRMMLKSTTDGNYLGVGVEDSKINLVEEEEDTDDDSGQWDFVVLY